MVLSNTYVFFPWVGKKRGQHRFKNKSGRVRFRLPTVRGAKRRALITFFFLFRLRE